MRYISGAAFRRALEDRLRMRSLQSGTPLVRIRKMIAFDRFLARLLDDQPENGSSKVGWRSNCGWENGLEQQKTLIY